MKRVAAILGVLTVVGLGGVVTAQGEQCTAGSKQYDSGTTVCMRGFEQQCVNGSWVNQQRFCSEDTQFEVIREPAVPVPQAGGPDQPAVPAAPSVPGVVVPQQ